jgi:hypothetical protein
VSLTIIRSLRVAAVFAPSAFVVPAMFGTESVSMPTASGSGQVFFEGGTILAMESDFQPRLIFKKYPPSEPVRPNEPWQLSLALLLNSAAPSIAATLRLDPAHPDPGILVLDDTASLVPSQGMYHNDDPSERFLVSHIGTLDPFVGPVHFLVAPDGFEEFPLLVYLNVTDRPGFPLELSNSAFTSVAAGDIIGDGALEFVIPGGFAQQGLHAFDQTGTPLPGWPFLNNDPDVFEQSFNGPTLADLDGDGRAEVVVVGLAWRDAPAAAAQSGSLVTTTLYALDGSGIVRWEAAGEFYGVPAVADIDGDDHADVIVGEGGTLKRFTAQGVPLSGWEAESPTSIQVNVPVLADLDGDASNGHEILACAFVSEPPFGAKVYVWNEDGSLHAPAWPRAMNNCVPPTVLDLDLDPGNGQEIVLASDHLPDPPVDSKTGFRNTFTVFAWHADGSDVDGWPHPIMRHPDIGLVDDRVVAPVSAGDLDRNGDWEIVVGVYGQGDSTNGNLFVFHHDGTLDANWPRWAGTAQTPSDRGGVALADLDGDGRLEIATASFFGVYVFRSNGELFDGFPRRTPDVFTQAIIADIDADGSLDILQASVGNRVFGWRVLAPSTQPLPWPQYRQNPAHTGTIDRDPAATIPALSTWGLTALACLLVCAAARIVVRATQPVESAD